MVEQMNCINQNHPATRQEVGTVIRDMMKKNVESNAYAQLNKAFAKMAQQRDEAGK